MSSSPFSEMKQSLVERMFDKSEGRSWDPDEMITEGPPAQNTDFKREKLVSVSSGYGSGEDEDFGEDKEFDSQDIEKLMLEDNCDILCTDELCCNSAVDPELWREGSVSSSDTNYKVDDLGSLSAALGENIRKIWSPTEKCTVGAENRESCETESQTSGTDGVYLSLDPHCKIWNYRVFLRMFPDHSNYQGNSRALPELPTEFAKYSEKTDLVPPSTKCLEVSDVTESVKVTIDDQHGLGSLDVDETCPEDNEAVENRIQCYRTSLNKLVDEIIGMTKEAEDSLVETGKQQETVKNEVTEELKLDDEGSVSEDDWLSDTDEDSDDEQRPPEKTSAPPPEKTSEPDISPQVEFLKGFSHAYENYNPDRFTPRRPLLETSPFGVLKVPCSDWCDSNPESHISACRSHINISPDLLSELRKGSEPYEPLTCCFGEKASESNWPLCPQDEKNTYSVMPAKHSSSELLHNDELWSGSFRNFLNTPDVAPSNPVEEFVNSLYLPEGVLPPEIPAVLLHARKRRASTSSVVSSGVDEAKYRSLRDFFGSSLENLPPDSARGGIRSAPEISKTDIWGDEGEENYWTPLPVPTKSDAESSGYHPKYQDSRKGRSNKYMFSQVNSRHIQTSRNGPAVPRW